jgi:hypothetical protein
MRKPKPTDYPTLDDLAGVMLQLDHGPNDPTLIKPATIKRFRRIYEVAYDMQSAEKHATKDKRHTRWLRFRFSEVQ